VRVGYGLGGCETLLKFYEGPDTIGDETEWRQWGICDWFVRSAGCLLAGVYESVCCKVLVHQITNSEVIDKTQGLLLCCVRVCVFSFPPREGDF